MPDAAPEILQQVPLLEANNFPIDVSGEGLELWIDRMLPQLAICRCHDARNEDLPRLTKTQPSYLIANDRTVQPTMNAVVTQLSNRFDTILAVELWESAPPERGKEGDAARLKPHFEIRAPEHPQLTGTVEQLARSLKKIAIDKRPADVELFCEERPSPDGKSPLKLNVPGFLISIGVAPIYYNPETKQRFPVVYERLRRKLATALKRAHFYFARTQTDFKPTHFLSLGSSRLSEVVHNIDTELTRIEASFDFLLQTIPVNAQEAWKEFKEADFKIDPTFHYRPLPVDTEKLKRELFQLPIEKVDDPSFTRIFREKQEEIDRKLTMLRERDSRRFFLGSKQLFGELRDDLLEKSKRLLKRLPERNTDRASPEKESDLAFAAEAEKEFSFYRKQLSSFPEKANIRADIPPGLMVSRGQLLIGEGTTVPKPRVQALIHHEVGTHMLTYHNGKVQPFNLLHTGLASYEGLQEGLAVLSEHLAGGLTVPRMRVLAARVVAAKALLEDASFSELFDLLTESYSFDHETAFSICTRTFRGGGFLKDIIYLRGLNELIKYLRDGGELEPLFIGKIALRHRAFIRELKHRGIVQTPPLRPRVLDLPGAKQRLERVKSGLTIIDLVN